jgi:peroxiredoxin
MVIGANISKGVFYATAGVMACVMVGCGPRENSSSRGTSESVADTSALERRSQESAATPTSTLPTVGQSLPYTRFIAGDGHVVDLARATDRRYSLLVFMRGYPGYVCPFCTRQTAVLLKRHDEILTTQTKLFIVFPGPADTIPKFLAAVRDYLGNGNRGEPAVPLLMDVDLKAVDALGIRHQLAYPSTFVVDATGKLVFVYVGKTPSDRPPLDDILQILNTGPDDHQSSGKQRGT